MTAQRQIHNLALTGFMGTGKSTVGRILAEQLHFDFVDTDELIERRAGKSIARIFAEEGEPAFREWERQVVGELAARRRTIIATGGGLGANEIHVAALREHALVVCLWSTAEGVYGRVRSQSHRPLLQGPNPLQKIRELLAARGPSYKKADVLISTEFRSVRDVAEHVIHQFRVARKKSISP